MIRSVFQPAQCRRADHHLSRRLFLQGAGAAALGGFGRLFAADNATKAASQQKHVILVFMSGGPSQFETWDPKTGRPTGGPHMNIQTTVPGVRFDEYMPNLAGLADKMAVIRSMTSPANEHAQANYHLHSGFSLAGHPSAGAWVSYGLGSECREMPGFLVLAGGGAPLGGVGIYGSGYLPAIHRATLLDPAANGKKVTVPKADIAKSKAEQLIFNQKVRAMVDGTPRRLHVCTSCIRNGKVQKAA